MQKWWNWILFIALVCLLFIAIPLTYTTSPSGTKDSIRPMFDEYIKKYNKSYKNNPAEYETRLEHFVVSKLHLITNFLLLTIRFKLYELKNIFLRVNSLRF